MSEPILSEELGAMLGGIVLLASDDPVKTDLEVTCRDCRAVLCDAEHNDTLDVLVGVVLDHVLRECPGTEGDHR